MNNVFKISLSRTSEEHVGGELWDRMDIWSAKDHIYERSFSDVPAPMTTLYAIDAAEKKIRSMKREIISFSRILENRICEMYLVVTKPVRAIRGPSSQGAIAKRRIVSRRRRNARTAA